METSLPASTQPSNFSQELRSTPQDPATRNRILHKVLSCYCSRGNLTTAFQPLADLDRPEDQRVEACLGAGISLGRLFETVPLFVGFFTVLLLLHHDTNKL